MTPFREFNYAAFKVPKDNIFIYIFLKDNLFTKVIIVCNKIKHIFGGSSQVPLKCRRVEI